MSKQYHEYFILIKNLMKTLLSRKFFKYKLGFLSWNCEWRDYLEYYIRILNKTDYLKKNFIAHLEIQLFRVTYSIQTCITLADRKLHKYHNFSYMFSEERINIRYEIQFYCWNNWGQTSAYLCWKTICVKEVPNFIFRRVWEKHPNRHS